jgi:hypothetical protein
MRLIPKNEEALKAKIEDIHHFITRDLVIYAIKTAWQDYRTETRITAEPVCLASWIAFVQSYRASILKDAGVPIIPETAYDKVTRGLAMCRARGRSECSDEDARELRESLHGIKANFLAVEFLSKETDTAGLPIFRLTNRSKRTIIRGIYIPLFMEDKKHLLQVKRAEIAVSELLPGKSVVVYMSETPDWKNDIRNFYKANNVTETGNIEPNFGSVSFRLQDISTDDTFPFDWFE